MLPTKRLKLIPLTPTVSALLPAASTALVNTDQRFA